MAKINLISCRVHKYQTNMGPKLNSEGQVRARRWWMDLDIQVNNKVQQLKENQNLQWLIVNQEKSLVQGKLLVKIQEIDTVNQWVIACKKRQKMLSLIEIFK
jgi:hypothetical protein